MGKAINLKRRSYTGRTDYSYLEFQFSSEEGKGRKVLTAKKREAM